MPRLVKTVTEMEGRFEEKWVLVDDGPELATWPVGPLRVVGRPQPRQDGPRRVSGGARYTVDVTLPGLLQAAVLRSPIAHGRVRGLDLEAARAVPGVRAVLGPESKLGFSLRQPPLVAEPEYAGAPIAVVAADSRAAARAGLAALALDLEPLPHVVDVDEAIRDHRLDGDPSEEGRGDVDAALAAADVRVEVVVETPAQLQTPLEPHAAVAWWQADELLLFVSTQGIFAARQELSRRFDVPLERIRVVAEYIGGGFGGKQGAGFEGLMAVELSRITGHPVRLANDRHGEQLDGGCRAPTRQTIRLGASRDGTLRAVDSEVLVSRGFPGWRAVNIPAMTLYRCADARGIEASLAMHLRPGNAFRAPCVMEGVTGLEQAMDELAIALDLDPLELRRRNFVDVDQASGLPYSSNSLLACYARAAELAGWADRDALRDGSADGWLRGLGCATQIWWGGGGPPSHATVRMGQDGVATVVTGIQDIGTGTLTAMQVVAAEELGIAAERVRVTGGDTLPNVFGPTAGGSQTTPSVTPAVRGAAAEVRRKLLALAGDVFEIASADLDLVGGEIRSRDGALTEPYTAVVSKLGDATIDGGGLRGPNPDGFRVHTFGCQIAQVAVDPGTGEVVVERIVAVHDIGRVINPLGASSQVEGGVLQGMAYALSEERVVDPTTGVPANASLDDYKLPTIADTPEIVVEFVDVPDDGLSNTGAKGLGEPPIVPTAAAIANAFRHATGVRPRALPLTRARVIELLGGGDDA
jgi:xanthine dehydrogenase YagR molybdenum-binding subunit